MKKSVRIFWRIFLFGFVAFVLLIALANFGVFGKMPSLAGTGKSLYPASF